MIYGTKILFTGIVMATFMTVAFTHTTEAAAFQTNCGDPACNACASPAPAVSCDCGKTSCLKSRPKLLRCGSCKRTGGCVQCPQCDADVCKLDVKESKSEKSCFKVKTETICIPKVRLPWQKCCPPMTSKTKVVKRLSTHKYECPSCDYKWSVQEKKECDTCNEAVVAQPAQPTEHVVGEVYYAPQGQTIESAAPATTQPRMPWRAGTQPGQAAPTLNGSVLVPGSK